MTATLVRDPQPRKTTRSGARHPAGQVIIENIGLPQALRWRDGYLYFSDQLDDTVYRWRPGGELEVMAHVPLANGLGFLPDGRLLINSTGDTCIYRRELDGTLVTHADLRGLVGGPLNDMITDGAGRAWVGNYGFDYDAAIESAPNSKLYAPPGIPTTHLIRIEPDGTPHVDPATVTFPNGACFIDNGRTLLLCESLAFRLMAMDISADDACLGNPYEWAPLIEPGLWTALNAPGLKGGIVRTVTALVDQPAFARFSSSPIAPEALAAHPDGSVYVANAVRGEVVRVARGGRIVERIGTRGHTVGVLVGGEDDDRLYVATLRTLDPTVAAREHSACIEVVDLPTI